ncbi:MAG: hypothetical protein HQL53_13160 [Magnetococcales bacterium]|nr:hypothetical protein [Magnetococcales bacterium]
MQATLSSDGQNIIIRIPLSLKRQGGRKKIIPPQGADSAFATPQIQDEALLKALGRGLRWLEMLETGKVASFSELATKEGMDPSYIMRNLRLTLLAPDIIKIILDGTHPKSITLDQFRRPFPNKWSEQRALFGLTQ